MRGQGSKRLLPVALLCAVAVLTAGAGDGSTEPRPGGGHGGVKLRKIADFDHPVFVTGAPGFPKLLFVVEQPGKVKVVRRGHKLRRSFLNIAGLVNYDGAERGLLSIAFPPDYKRSRRFYVYYNDAQGDIRVDEFKRRSATVASAGSRRSVIQIPHHDNTNHNGGQLEFLGHLLYLGTGDGGSAGDPADNAQNKRVLLGKLLRIDPRNPRGKRDYRVPRSNPFVGRPGRNEIYSYGLRNPWRFSFDRVTAKRPRIAIGDVGQDSFEEVDYETVRGASGANFGWDAFEGFAHFEPPFPRHTTKPVYAYGRSRGGGSCGVIGGYVVRDPHLRSLYKRYVYADLCEGAVRSFAPSLHRVRRAPKVGVSTTNPTSFGEDDHGRLYLCSLDGPVYRIAPASRR
jgi:glucose/arabinose dehydrogenase